MGAINFILEDDLHKQLKKHCVNIDLSVAGWLRIMVGREMAVVKSKEEEELKKFHELVAAEIKARDARIAAGEEV
jgi:hypothetical protein